MTPRARLALLVVGGYVAVAFAAGNFYPFSVFDMYSRPAENGSRLVALHDGRAEEVTRYRSWRCDGEIDLDRCGPGVVTTEPVDRELLGWVRTHTGEGSVPVELARRVWYFDKREVRVEDCVIARCRVAK